MGAIVLDIIVTRSQHTEATKPHKPNPSLHGTQLLFSLTIMGRVQAPVFRDGISEPSEVLREYIQRRSKR